MQLDEQLPMEEILKRVEQVLQPERNDRLTSLIETINGRFQARFVDKKQNG
jgi:hypothetical protein